MKPLSKRTETFTDSVIRRMPRVCLACGAVNLSQGLLACLRRLPRCVIGTVVALMNLFAWGESRDTVMFTLTFADRPVPDMRGYEALWLTGNGFKYDNDRSVGVTYGWYVQVLKASGLSWKLTHDGYANYCCHGGRRPYGVELAASALTNLATDICLEDAQRNRELKLGV